MQSLLGKEKDCVTPQRNSTLERVTVILASSRWVYEQDICYFYRCLFDRNHSKLRSLARLPESEEFIKSQVGLLFSLISAQNIRVYRRWGDLKRLITRKQHFLVWYIGPIVTCRRLECGFVERFSLEMLDIEFPVLRDQLNSFRRQVTPSFG